jgi:predicted Fe-Mo cluster-binding NifX family protein
MKIIITTTAPDLDSAVDPRFGRGAYMLSVDSETLQWHADANAAASAPGGAGIQAAQFAVNQKVEAVISGDFGPNAYNALNAAGVAMYLFGSGGTARQVVERFKAGDLQRVGAATQAGHFGRRG